MVSERIIPASCANDVRGLIMGGSALVVLKMKSIIFQLNLVVKQRFGDLTQQVNNLASCSSSTRGFRIAVLKVVYPQMKMLLTMFKL